VEGTTYSNLPQGSPFVANGALVVAEDVSALALDVKTLAVSGKITLNGAPPIRTCTSATPANVLLVDHAHHYALTIPAACNDAFAFSGNVYPGIYEISVQGTTYSNLPQGSPYVAVELIQIP
jgi:hypothetical protein